MNQEPKFRIEVGKENCLNDIPVYLVKTLPEIISYLKNNYGGSNFTEMLNQIERLKRVTKDLEDMTHELKNLQK